MSQEPAPAGGQTEPAFLQTAAAAPTVPLPADGYSAASDANPGHPGPTEPYVAYRPPGAVPRLPGARAKTNGFAIASLIFGILGGLLFSVPFGVVALVQIRKRGQGGRGRAIAGLILSAVWALVILLVLEAQLDGPGPKGTNADGTTSYSMLKPGDCMIKVFASGYVLDVQVVSCDTPHEGEVFAVFDLPDGERPSETAVKKQAASRCNEEFASYARAPDDELMLYYDKLMLYYRIPQVWSWPQDRRVICTANDPNGPRTRSLRD